MVGALQVESAPMLTPRWKVSNPPDPHHDQCGCSKKTENNVSRGNSPYVNEGKGGTLAQKSHESPPPQLHILPLIVGAHCTSSLGPRAYSASGGDVLSLIEEDGGSFVTHVPPHLVLLWQIQKDAVRCVQAFEAVPVWCNA
eukprot:scaffold156144_cov17-Tisochrysis_lutea.AAC.2